MVWKKKSRFRPNNSRCSFWEYSRHEKISSWLLGKKKNQQTFCNELQFQTHSCNCSNITNSSKQQVKLRLVQSGFMSLWQASRQRRINNIDLRINHIVQDSEGIPKHVINHPNATRHCVDWLFIWKRQSQENKQRAGVYLLSVSGFKSIEYLFKCP